jgi:hypothetical protein
MHAFLKLDVMDVGIATESRSAEGAAALPDNPFKMFLNTQN